MGISDNNYVHLYYKKKKHCNRCSVLKKRKNKMCCFLSFIIVQKLRKWYHQFQVPLQEICWYLPEPHSRELPPEFLREAGKETKSVVYYIRRKLRRITHHIYSTVLLTRFILDFSLTLAETNSIILEKIIAAINWNLNVLNQVKDLAPHFQGYLKTQNWDPILE